MIKNVHIIAEIQSSSTYHNRNIIMSEVNVRSLHILPSDPPDMTHSIHNCRKQSLHRYLLILCTYIYILCWSEYLASEKNEEKSEISKAKCQMNESEKNSVGNLLVYLLYIFVSGGNLLTSYIIFSSFIRVLVVVVTMNVLSLYISSQQFVSPMKITSLRILILSLIHHLAQSRYYSDPQYNLYLIVL